MGCRESALNYLHSLGYNVVLLPKSDVSPLLLLSFEGRGTFDRFGRLETVLVGDGSVPMPPVTADLPAANLSGRSSSSLRLGLGLNVLTNIISAMGGSPLGLEAVYRKAAMITFEFRDVYEDRIEVAALDRYLAGADIDPYSKNAARLLSDSDLLVVTSTLKTSAIGVRATDRANTSLALDVPVVQDIVGGSVTVDSSRQDSTLLSYTGPARLIFGFQAVRLHYEDGFYRAIEPAAGVRMRAPLSDVPDDGAERFLTPGPMVRLSDA